jgi:hypothetical protein
MTMFPDKPAVKQAMATLLRGCGNTEAVAMKLFLMGVKGAIGYACDCPLGLGLTLILTEAGYEDADVIVGLSDVGIYDWGDSRPRMERFSLDLPPLLDEFRDAFDASFFPELDSGRG